MMDHIREFLAAEDGLTSVEYALLLALIVVVSLATWSALGQEVRNKANEVATNLAATP